MNVHTIEGLRLLARRRTPKVAFDFVDGGAGRETGLGRNVDAFARLQLLPRMLTGTEKPALSRSLFGRLYALPFGVAPIGMANFLWPGTDTALARAAVAHDAPYILSTAGTTSIETIARIAPEHGWFQLYVGRSQEVVDDLVDRADASGRPVLVVTVDVPMPGRRVRDLVNGFALPFRYSRRFIADVARHPGWAAATLRAGPPRFANLERYSGKDSSARSLAEFMARQSSARLDWALLAKLRDRWRRPLVVKGLLHPEDAARAAELGVDGVVVSNHGARQLDSAPAPLDMLPAVRDAVGGRAAVLLDGGVRSGEDVAKALALGADFVLLGRAFLYAAAALGPERGAVAAFGILKDELGRTLTQLGCREVDALDRSYLLGGSPPAHN